jgi:hypothetical protein
VTDTIRDSFQTLITLLGPEGGDWPTAAEEVDFLIPTRVSRPTNGQQLNTISFRWALERSNDRLVDAVTPAGYDRLVDVHAYNPDDGTTRRLCWGKLGEQSHYLSGTNEGVEPTARIDPWLIGELKTTGPRVRRSDDTDHLIEGPIVFNPENEAGRIVGNRSSSVNAYSRSWWLHPETARTPAAATAQGQTSELWTLPQAVLTMCWLLNPLEKFVRNPLLADLESKLVATDVSETELLRNVSLDPDLWLSECLDRLLEPYGFAWSLKFDDDLATAGNDKLHTSFAFHKLNDGPQRVVYSQRPGTTHITREKTNVADYHANISITDLANQIEGFTAPIVVESTFEMYPAWPIDNDAETQDELNTKEQRANGEVHRVYLLNEDGSLNGIRNAPTEATDLDDLLTEPHPADGVRVLSQRRRRFLPAMSEGLERGSAENNASSDRELIGEDGFLLEYKQRYKYEVPAEDEDDPPTVVTVVGDWEPVDWPFTVLKDRCGIRLTGPVRPELWSQLQDFPDETPLRITCCVESDFARHKIASRQDSSPQADVVRSVLDLSSRFHVRRVDSTSVLYADRHPAITAVGLQIGFLSLYYFEVGSLNVPPQTGDRIAVTGSTGNDGLYTVADYEPPRVFVQELIPDTATADGNLSLFTREVDDTRELQKYLEHIRDWDDSADLSCSVTLDGIDHHEYGLGDLITKVDGRNLSLDANSPTATAPKFLQIMGLNMELEGQQKTELLLESFKLERFDFGRNS